MPIWLLWKYMHFRLIKATLTQCCAVMLYGDVDPCEHLDQVMACCLMAPSHCMCQCCCSLLRPCVAFIWGQFHAEDISIWFWKLLICDYSRTASHRGQWAKTVSVIRITMKGYRVAFPQFYEQMPMSDIRFIADVPIQIYVAIWRHYTIPS